MISATLLHDLLTEVRAIRQSVKELSDRETKVGDVTVQLEKEYACPAETTAQALLQHIFAAHPALGVPVFDHAFFAFSRYVSRNNFTTTLL